MNDTTLCPQCATRFKVSEEQLDAHDGLVRCGRCQNVFNAREHLQDDEPSPQLSLLIDEEPSHADEGPSDDTGERTINTLATQEDISEAAQDETTPGETGGSDTPASSNETSAEDEAHDQPDLSPIPNLTELEDEPTTLAQQVQFVDDPTDEDKPVAPKPKHHLATFWGVTLFLLLTAQATYHFRDALAVKLPGLKPLLVELCGQLDCTVELPRDVELLSIESSELEADAKLVNVITLHALLHNRARYAQAWPSLELTLTDSRDDVIARRTFHPAAYLKNEDELELGIGHSREREIALRLDTTDLRPSGYRLLLFYPL
ncbi:MAG: zinc-ribbon domain-containing protein [Gammaproteobacteria bacterium]|nr:zinc-ribbon domain-containing protein [Gammaproteobacteria bacterium]MBU1624095.1 zinc-ribbon domain-containing protein [Gammaproteobacteria bacterium]MBU1981823.1 zinc-ribbon domain-containing protein [Gammaproteobacteria bacterium]